MNAPPRRGSLLIFAKAPRPGLVKTRLSPPFSPQQAADFYSCMLSDVLSTSARASQALGLEAILAVYPVDALQEMADRCPAGFRVVAQRGRDLSERMAWALAETAAASGLPVLLRGSDSPLLSERVHERALLSLDTHDLVVSPARDGGYSLIGLRNSCLGLFDHAMSTDSVLDDTLANADAAGLKSEVLEVGSDVDTVADLAMLERVRNETDREQCPLTYEFLARCDAWASDSAS